MKEENHLTTHGRERIEERVNNAAKKPPNEQAEMALKFGLDQNQLSGGFYRWVDRRRYKYPGKKIKVFRNFLYIFGWDSPHRLVTVFPIPKKYRSDCKRLEKKQRRNRLRKDDTTYEFN